MGRPSSHQVPAAGAGEAASSPSPPPGPPVPEPTHAERARTIVAGTNRATLCTLAADPAGYPFGSVVTYALDQGAAPLVFLSLMAEHTQNAERDRRASLLVTEAVGEGADPLAFGRVTLLGDLGRVADGDVPAARDRYLAANPSAAYYIDFGDFAFYRLALRCVRYVGGFGRMSWVDAEAFAGAEPDPLQPAAGGIIAHMNADHADALALVCRHHAGRPDTVEARMTAVDRYGFEVLATGPAGRAGVRIGFPGPLSSTDDVRAVLVAMVRDARNAG